VLHSVTLSGPGFRRQLGEIAPASTVETSVEPVGESSISISFRALGKNVRVPPDGYFEGGGRYVVVVVVHPDLSVGVSSHTRSY
jgi:hypothetical protein